MYNGIVRIKEFTTLLSTYFSAARSPGLPTIVSTMRLSHLLPPHCHFNSGVLNLRGGPASGYRIYYHIRFYSFFFNPSPLEGETPTFWLHSWVGTCGVSRQPRSMEIVGKRCKRVRRFTSTPGNRRPHQASLMNAAKNRGIVLFT